MKKLILFLLFLLLFAPIIYAKEGHLTLLAVKDNGDDYEGTTADLYLELKPGSGRVFLDTFPLTKTDTQISTRFSRDVACSYLDIDCYGYDFVYTIKADSPIIAGPSAGGAITLLTIALLDDLELDEQISITGTINSGGIIGSVGGIKAKIDAAKEYGLSKVLIPAGERFFDEDKSIGYSVRNETTLGNVSLNKTIDLIEYGKANGIIVVEVSDIGEVLYEFTGIEFEENVVEFDIDEMYEDTMNLLAVELCNRSNILLLDLNKIYVDEHNETRKAALDLIDKGKSALSNNTYYSAASYCFGANVKLTYLLIELSDSPDETVEKKINVIEKNIGRLEQNIDEREKKTVTDLEAYMIVKGRLVEAKGYMNDTLAENDTTKRFYNLAYSFERVYSAFSWANFFDHRGNEFDFNQDALEDSCRAKLAEAEERYHYVLLFYPVLEMSNTKKEIDYAYGDLEGGDYELCLFKAAKAKAESDILLGVGGIGDDKSKELLDKKIEVAKKNIAKQVSKGNFPILAYSYYEYANNLKGSDKYSALLYAEYAIELSNLDMYFKRIKSHKFEFNAGPVFYVIIGLIAGVLISYIVSRVPSKQSKKLSRKNDYKPRQSSKALLGKKR